mmetsp:Transcript_14069/g.21029  ORF Transcript_14069/g.21029 Transcript_14069/m.21029 type:complete len:610 (+) Transcript_14069:265-2094(+)
MNHDSTQRMKELTVAYEGFEVKAKESFNSIYLRHERPSKSHMTYNTPSTASSSSNEGSEDLYISEMAYFSAILHVATDLISEIPLYVDAEIGLLRSICFGNCCLNKLLQLIGGQDGKELSTLSIDQLFELIVWIESFHEVVEEAHPNVKSNEAKREFRRRKPSMFLYDLREEYSHQPLLQMSRAVPVLTWILAMYWKVHMLAQDEFLIRTKATTDKWLQQVYSMEREVWQTKEGRLVTSLCEDLVTIISAQIWTMQSRLSGSSSSAFIIGVCLTFSRLREKQLDSRDIFFTDLDSCCAAANNFLRISEKLEELFRELIQLGDMSGNAINMLEGCRGDLVSTFCNDAVYSAEKAHSYIFQPIRKSLSEKIFDHAWLNLTHNELALSLTRTLGEFINDKITFLDEFLVSKLVFSILKATVIFYLECIIRVAGNKSKGNLPFFHDASVAIKRFEDDISILRDFFESTITLISLPSMPKAYARELEILSIVNELLIIAARNSSEEDLSEDNATNLILQLHKYLEDIKLTRWLVGDIWYLVQPKQKKKIKSFVLNQKQMLHEVSIAKKTRHKRECVQELEVGIILTDIYDKRKNRRKLQSQRWRFKRVKVGWNK